MEHTDLSHRYIDGTGSVDANRVSYGEWPSPDGLL